MTLIGFLMGFPALAALVLLFAARTDGARGITVRFSALVTALAAFATAVTYFNSGTVMFSVGSELFSSLILAMEVILGLIILYVSFKAGRILIGLLGIAQTALITWFELGPGHGVQISSDFTIDLFIIIMIMIVGVIGSLITVFALGCMKDFQQRAKDQTDNQPFFFFVTAERGGFHDHGGGRPKCAAADQHQIAEQHRAIDIGLRHADRQRHAGETEPKPGPLQLPQPLAEQPVGAERHEERRGVEKNHGARGGGQQ